MEYKYLNTIKRALNKLYINDIDLFEGRMHEQTFSFRIAHYLSQELENNQPKYKIDCEYHRDINNSCGYKEIINSNGISKRIRPDIIYHDRNRCNKFCIEIKIKSMRQDDIKVENFIKHYKYQEGYCIYNLKNGSVKIKCMKYINNKVNYKIIKYTFNTIQKCLIGQAEVQNESL